MSVCKFVPTKIKIRNRREDGLHERASRLGASLPVEMTYVTVPMAKSAEDPEIVLEQWPILAPYDFVTKLQIDVGVFFFWRLLVNICIFKYLNMLHPKQISELRYPLYCLRAFWVP